MCGDLTLSEPEGMVGGQGRADGRIQARVQGRRRRVPGIARRGCASFRWRGAFGKWSGRFKAKEGKLKGYKSFAYILSLRPLTSQQCAARLSPSPSPCLVSTVSSWHFRACLPWPVAAVPSQSGFSRRAATKTQSRVGLGIGRGYISPLAGLPLVVRCRSCRAQPAENYFERHAATAAREERKDSQGRGGPRG